MTELLPGLAIGVAIGFAVYWLIDNWARRMMPGGVHETVPVRPSAQPEIKPEVQAQDNPRTEEPTTVAEPSAPVESPIRVDLQLVRSIPANYRELLESKGVSSPDDLAKLSSDSVAEMLGIQPWDDVDPSPWIEEAKALSGGSASQSEVEQSKPSHGDDLTLIGITSDQVSMLQANGLASYHAIASASQEELLDAIGAQPWDMIDVEAWIRQAKDRA